MVTARLFFGAVTVDLTTGTLTDDEGTKRLTRIELALLRRLAASMGTPVSRETLLEDVWELAPTTRTRCVDSTIHRLRRKLEVEPRQPEFLLQDYGHGYRLELPTTSTSTTDGALTPLVGREAWLDTLRTALAAGHRVIALTGPPGIGARRLATAVAHSDRIRVASHLADLEDWLAESPQHQALITGRYPPVPGVHTLEIPPLSPTAAKTLLETCGPHALTEAQLQTALARTGGVPAAILEQGMFIQLLGPEAALQQRLMEERLTVAWDTLPPSHRTLLRHLAEPSGSISTQAVLSISSTAVLAHLRRQSWLLRDGDRVRVPEPARAFVLDMPQEDDWALLPWAGELGREICLGMEREGLRAAPTDAQSKLLIHAAQRSTSEDGSWALLGAATWFTDHAHALGETLLTAHIDVATDPEIRSRLFVLRSHIRRIFAQDALAAADGRTALQLAPSPIVEMLAHAAIGYATVKFDTGGLDHLDNAIALAEVLEARTLLGTYLAATAVSYRAVGDLPQAVARLERALAMNPSRPNRVSIRHQLALTLCDLGELDRASSVLSRALQEAREHGLHAHIAVCSTNMGLVRVLQSRDPSTWLDEGEAAARSLGYAVCLGIAHSIRALQALFDGHHAVAEALLHESIHTLPDSPMRGLSMAWLARLEVALGRPNTPFEDALRLCAEDPDRAAVVRLLMGTTINRPETALMRLARRVDQTLRRAEAHH